MCLRSRFWPLELFGLTSLFSSGSCGPSPIDFLTVLPQDLLHLLFWLLTFAQIVPQAPSLHVHVRYGPYPTVFPRRPP